MLSTGPINSNYLKAYLKLTWCCSACQALAYGHLMCPSISKLAKSSFLKKFNEHEVWNLTLPESSNMKKRIGIIFMLRSISCCSPKGQWSEDKNSVKPASLGLASNATMIFSNNIALMTTIVASLKNSSLSKQLL